MRKQLDLWEVRFHFPGPLLLSWSVGALEKGLLQVRLLFALCLVSEEICPVRPSRAWVCVCVYVWVYLCLYLCASTCISVYVSVVCICACVCLYTCLCPSVPVSLCLCVHVSVSVLGPPHLPRPPSWESCVLSKVPAMAPRGGEGREEVEGRGREGRPYVCLEGRVHSLEIQCLQCPALFPQTTMQTGLQVPWCLQGPQAHVNLTALRDSMGFKAFATQSVAGGFH